MTTPKEILQGVAKGLDDVFNGPVRPKKYGFALLVFEFGKTDNGMVDYVSNAERNDMITAMKEWVARAEGRVIDTETKQ
jgi:hypothetical protein